MDNQDNQLNKEIGLLEEEAITDDEASISSNSDAGGNAPLRPPTASGIASQVGGGGGGESQTENKKTDKGVRGSKKIVKDEQWKEANKEKQKQYHEATKKHRAAYKAASRGLTKHKRNVANLHTEYLPKYVPSERGNKPQANLEWFDFEKAKITLVIKQPTPEIIALLKQHQMHISETTSGEYEP